jgi:major membrane immunogen (membrane-anchored lipoprotein)
MLFGCTRSSLEEPSVTRYYKDGTYYAEEAEYNEITGWKSTVSLTVEDGIISDVNWSALSNKVGIDKKAASINGDYQMVEEGGAQAQWHEQAALTEAYLLECQDPFEIEYSDEEGHTDTISGVTIHVNDFRVLVIEALEESR